MSRPAPPPLTPQPLSRGHCSLRLYWELTASRPLSRDPQPVKCLPSRGALTRKRVSLSGDASVYGGPSGTLHTAILVPPPPPPPSRWNWMRLFAGSKGMGAVLVTKTPKGGAAPASICAGTLGARAARD